MLNVLFGNASIEKVLLFLFVNGKCYGSQLQKLLKTPLTPLQKAMTRLEEKKILTSYLEGKTKVYQFNPSCPILPELQQLLSKIFTLLPAPEQRAYYASFEGGRYALSNDFTPEKILNLFWKRLSDVKSFVLNAHSNAGEAWQKKGAGEVQVSREGAFALVFQEKGQWKDESAARFSNTYRWTLDLKAKVISLEHLRRGVEQPVFLFHLAPTTPRLLTSIDSHLCGTDTYLGKIHLESKGLSLKWRVIGPTKNQEIACFYSA